MKRRRLLLFAVLAVAFLVLGLLESQSIVSGWLNGERFYRGRPASYWRDELRHWNRVADGWAGPGDLFPPYREPSFWHRLPYVNRGLTARDEIPFVEGDPDARAMLLELCEDPDEHVRDIAAIMLKHLRKPPEE